MNCRIICCLLYGLLGWLTTIGTLAADRELPKTRQFRRPVALAFVQPQRLVVANRDGGSVSAVDLESGRVEFELAVGEQLSDLAVADGGDKLLVTDAAEDEVLVIDLATQKTLAHLPVNSSPVAVCLDTQRQQAWVALLWARQIAAIDLADLSKPRVQTLIDLDFAPRCLLLSPDKRYLFVADSFGGNLAAVDMHNLQIVRRRTFDGHNIRGMAWSGDRQQLLLSHQILHRDQATTSGGVHWGGVMSNVIRTVSLAEILSADGPLPVGGIYYLGHPDHAAGDPAGLAVTADGRQIVAYAGIDEVGISDRGGNYFKEVSVGRYPTALAVDPAGKKVCVVNTFGDSISVIDVAAASLIREISLGEMPKVDPVRQGEMLFHDARLASDGWYSCHSCHTDGHSNGGLNDNFSDRSYGAPKRVLSLLGVGDTGPWAWSGKVQDLESQIRNSIEITMRGPPATETQLKSLAAYLRTLRPPPSIARARGRIDTEQTIRGRQLFSALNCNQCHAGPSFTSPDAYDVGIRDEHGNTEFNPPSLRGVSQRDRWFHDNRAATLKDVFVRYRHNLDRVLSEHELADLMAYLNSL